MASLCGHPFHMLGHVGLLLVLAVQSSPGQASDDADSLGPSGACPTGGAVDSACSTGEDSGEDSGDDVNLLQYAKHAAADQIRKTERPAGPLAEALIDEVWTYGAPATHGQPFRNAATQDGCFPGLRSYNEDLKGVGDSIHQVDAGAHNNKYPHAYTNLVVLHKDRDSFYAPCTPETEFGHPTWPLKPMAQYYDEWRIHHEENYETRLQYITLDGRDFSGLELFKSAKDYLFFAFRSYDTTENTKQAMALRMPGWSLVSHEIYKTFNDEDPVMVMQEHSTLDCALVFTGTNNFADLPSSTTQYGTGYCGFTDVHVGYRNELWTITNYMWKDRIRPVLEQCKKVIVIGHSLGGALAEIFAACANSGNTTDPDFQLQAWTKAKSPRRMPAVMR